MKPITRALLLTMALLAASCVGEEPPPTTTTEGALAYACGTTSANTRDNTGAAGWDYDLQGNGDLHGKMYLSRDPSGAQSGAIRGFLDIPNELAGDPFWQAHWDCPVYGKQNAAGVWLQIPCRDSTLWTITATSTWDSKSRFQRMTGPQYAFERQEAGHGTFTATRSNVIPSIVAGMPILCEGYNVWETLLQGTTWRYSFEQYPGVVYHGNVPLNRQGDFVWGYLDAPDEMTDPTARSQWRAEMYGAFKNYGFNVIPPLEMFIYRESPDDRRWVEIQFSSGANGSYRMDSYGYVPPVNGTPMDPPDLYGADYRTGLPTVFTATKQ